MISTTAEGLTRKSVILKSSLEKASKRGVKIRVTAPFTKETKSLFKEFAKFADIKQANGYSRFFIIDGKKLIFPLLDDKKINPSYDTAIWVDSPFFASALQNMFNNVWKNLNSAKGK